MSDRAIISVTVLPSRLPHAGPCIESLKAQGLPLYVWIPKCVKRLGLRFDDRFPDYMMGCEGAVVADRGPIGTLLSALPLGDIVITADDDVVYGEGWARGLLKWHERLPEMALGYRGRVFRAGDRRYNESACGSLYEIAGHDWVGVDLLTGTWGALYRAGWFEHSIYEEWETWPPNDDIVINAHLRRRGVKRAVVPIPAGCEIEPLDGVHQIDALWAENIRRNDEGLEAVGWWA